MTTVSESIPTASESEKSHWQEMSERFARRCAKGDEALSRHIMEELSVDKPTDAEKVHRALTALEDRQRNRVMSILMNAVQYGV